MLNPEGAPIDTGWAWVVCFAGFMHTLFYALTLRTYGIFLVEFGEEFPDTSKEEISWIASVMFIFFFQVAPLCGIFCNVVSARLVSFVGGVFGAIGYIASAFAPNINTLFCTYSIFVGITCATTHITGMVMINQYFKRRRGIAVGIVVSGEAVGAFVGPPLVRFLLNEYGLRPTLIIYGSIFLHIPVFAALLRPLSFYSSYKLNERNSGKKMIVKSSVDSEGLVEGAVELEDMKEKDNRCSDAKTLLNMDVLKNPYFYLFGMTLGFVGLGGPMSFYLIPNLAKDINLSTEGVTLALFIQGFPDIIGRIFCGCLVDISWINPSHVLTLLSCIQGAGFIIASFVQTYTGILSFAVIVAFSSGGYVALYSPILIDTIGLANLSHGIGYGLAIEGISFIAVPPLIGFLRDSTKSWNWSFRLVGFLSIIGSMLLLPYQFHKYRKRKDEISAELEVGEDEEENMKL